jgi:hypothetical protein
MTQHGGKAVANAPIGRRLPATNPDDLRAKYERGDFIDERQQWSNKRATAFPQARRERNLLGNNQKPRFQRDNNQWML